MTYLTKELLTDIYYKLGKHRFIIVGSFVLAVLEHELLGSHTVKFADIDILCLKSSQRLCMPLYKYFKDKYDIQLSFNFYNPQYLGAEEVIQESSLFNIHRILFIPKERKIIYDYNTFERPTDILISYFTEDIQFNEDCCIYFYRKLEANLEQFKKHNIEVTPEIMKQLQKPLGYTTDLKYIEQFHNSSMRYQDTPETVYGSKPSGYYMVYYPVKKKFKRRVINVPYNRLGNKTEYCSK